MTQSKIKLNKVTLFKNTRRNRPCLKNTQTCAQTKSATNILGQFKSLCLEQTETIRQLYVQVKENRKLGSTSKRLNNNNDLKLSKDVSNCAKYV